MTCGSLFGIGLVTGGARWRTVSGILLAWVVGGLTYWSEKDVFLWTQDHGAPQEWFHVTADGEAEHMGDTGDFQYKGIAFFGGEVTATEETSFSNVKSLFR